VTSPAAAPVSGGTAGDSAATRGRAWRAPRASGPRGVRAARLVAWALPGRAGPSRRRAHRLSSRILALQLVILLVTSVTGFVLFAWAQRAQLDSQNMLRALDIAETVAAEPEIRGALTTGHDDGTVQSIAQRIRQASEASYIVVIDLDKVRHSHPDPALIGQKVTEPLYVLDGKGHTRIDNGSTGRSANGSAPIFGSDGKSVIGEVSAGIPDKDIWSQLWRELPVFALYAAIALGVGVVASFALARRLKRSTFGLELEEIAGLLQEREAMLHGVREGVVAFDPHGRVSVVNDEARRLLGFGTALGETLAALVPEGRLRDALDGTVDGPDVTVLTDQHCLSVNRMPVVLEGRKLGAVVTVRDRTEMVGLLRELDTMRGLTDALRAQQHEFSNRMHTLAGLLELDERDAALEYAVETAGAGPALAESLRERIGDPLLVGLLVAKTTVAAERGVELVVSPDTGLGEDVPHLRRLLTIVGNLLDNAIEAAAKAERGRVTLSLVRTAQWLTVRVADNGPGVPQGAPIFEDGYSTSPDRGTARRGLGLALVHRLVQRNHGTISVSHGPGAVFEVALPVPDPRPLPDGPLFTVPPRVLGEVSA
jgi:two-component system, CitB family, sensor kinase